MGLLKKLTTAFFLGVIFLVILLIANFFIPGKLTPGAFSNVGIIIIIATVFLDAMFNMASVD